MATLDQHPNFPVTNMMTISGKSSKNSDSDLAEAKKWARLWCRGTAAPDDVMALFEPKYLKSSLAQRILEFLLPPPSSFAADQIAGLAKSTADLALTDNLEFRCWLSFWDASDFFDVSVANGFHDLSALEAIDHTNDEAVNYFITKWSTACKLYPTSFVKFQAALQQLPEYRRIFDPTLLACRKELSIREHIRSFCLTAHDLGVAFKRGIRRTEKWKKRQFVICKGVLQYGDAGKEAGHMVLTHSILYEAKSKEADRPNCVDLYVKVPSERVFLLALESADEIPRWKRAIALHVAFCERWPDEVAAKE
eukprot:TRINITY_DN7199_c0_g1_i1.p1 TRINITY_DN7199_c0_g1~~TRINITY_DN7199_c0_g1_i1.p1  ORF type:complete len:308 (+),score=37.52 TRINITY_DN7199_c0_g1_i1:37-960(+)